VAEAGLVDIGDTKLFVERRGDGYPLIVLHGGPGLDHHMFADYLDPLADRYRLLLVDQRAQGRSERAPKETWTLTQMSDDVSALAGALRLDRYAVLGHSYGAFVALQHAVDYPSDAAQTVVSDGLPSVSYMRDLQATLDAFEPVELREQVAASWAKEVDVRTPEEAAQLLDDQLPYHFADPLDPRIAEYARKIAGMVASPDVLRHFAASEYGGIDVEDILDRVTHPVLVISGRHERTCPVEGAEAMAKGLPDAELVILEGSAHMGFVEENEEYVRAVGEFLDRRRAG
jgi:proline-specific peptidase